MTFKFIIYLFCIVKISVDTNEINYKVNDEMFNEMINFKNNSLDNEYASVTKIISQAGYKVESHTIVTEDGYILVLHRILCRKYNCKNKQKTPILCVHGLYSSSSGFVLKGPSHSLGYILVNNDYDVWLANCRASTYSRNHKSFSDDCIKFWDFSFHEKGIYDLPAMIDYILNLTGQNKLAYIGHSEGTTNLFVLLSTKPEYNKNISIAFMMSPIVYIKNMKIPFMTTLVNVANYIKAMCEEMEIGEFLPTSKIMTKYFCSKSKSINFICRFPFIVLLGLHMKQFDPEAFQLFLYHARGTSVKELLHYIQLYKSGEFSMFDYGFINNLLQYQTPSPPLYKLCKITVPIVLIYSQNDWFTSNSDITKLHVDLQTSVKLIVEDKTVNHLDFIMGKTAKEAIYDKILRILKNPKSVFRVKFAVQNIRRKTNTLL